MSYSKLQVNVDFDTPIEDMVVTGRYFFSTPHVTEANFPRPTDETGKKTLNVILYDAYRLTNCAGIKHDFEAIELKPATVRVLLAMGKQFPEMCREKRIAAIGSPLQCKNGIYYPCFNFEMGSIGAFPHVVVISRLLTMEDESIWMRQRYWRFSAIQTGPLPNERFPDKEQT